MQKHHQLTDNEFEEQFAGGTLPPAFFDHRAHLRLAWIHISRYGLQNAIDNVCAQIRNFATAHGDMGKYNETVTIAALKAVNHFMVRSGTTDFESFITENSRLVSSFKQLLSAHYSTDIFRSEQARTEYLEPDLLPFD